MLALHRLAGRASTRTRPSTTHEPRVLLDLVVAERLPGLELDQDGAGLVVGVQDDRIARAVRGLDRASDPSFHGCGSLTGRRKPGIDSSAPWRSPSTAPTRPDRDELLRRPRRPKRRRGGRRRSRARDAAEIRLELARLGATCAAILLTHSHYDHLGGVADLAEGTGAPVWLPEGEPTSSSARTTSSPASAIRPYEGEATLLSGGETIDAAGISFEVLPVPGPLARAPRLLRRRLRSSRATSSSPARSAAPTCRSATGTRCSSRSARSSTRYPPETVVYSGHGPPTTLGAELARNPFLAELRAA